MTTMEHETTAEESSNVTRLVSGILDDAQKLIGQQMAMVRAEVREDVRRTLSAVKYLGIGVGVAAVGALFVVVGLVPLLHDLAPSLPYWACWMIVGAVFVGLGAAALLAGRSILKSFNPLPDKSLNALQENVSWITTPRS